LSAGLFTKPMLPGASTRTQVDFPDFAHYSSL
jgi:hypothetical protein